MLPSFPFQYWQMFDAKGLWPRESDQHRWGFQCRQPWHAPQKWCNPVQLVESITGNIFGNILETHIGWTWLNHVEPSLYCFFRAFKTMALDHSETAEFPCHLRLAPLVWSEAKRILAFEQRTGPTTKRKKFKILRNAQVGNEWKRGREHRKLQSFYTPYLLAPPSFVQKISFFVQLPCNTCNPNWAMDTIGSQTSEPWCNSVLHVHLEDSKIQQVETTNLKMHRADWLLFRIFTVTEEWRRMSIDGAWRFLGSLWVFDF